MSGEHFDVVVVGAGAGGGVVASRLSEDSDRTVLLLEAGPDFPDEAEIPPLFMVSGERTWAPAGIPELDWDLYDAPLPSGRRVRLPRGKLVGGSSMANATVAVRGADFDFARWEAMGCTGWGWDDVLPRYVRLETDADFPDAPYHGDEGPIHIRRYRPDEWTPVHEPFVEACTDLGLAHVDDLNAPGADVASVGAWPHNRRHEVRLGTLPTYVRAARARPNFTVRGGALVERVLLDGDRATGVRYLEPGGVPAEVGADHVIVCGGAYGTPAILERSGIGRPEVLAAAGIDAVVDLPVGENLLDHPNCVFAFHAPALAGNLGRLFATNCRAPVGMGGEPEWQGFAMPVDADRGLAGVVVCLNRQDASGSVHVTSADPAVAPRIDHRYLTEAGDLQRYEHAWAFFREMLARPAFARHGARELTAGRAVQDILLEGLSTAHHCCGTARMGPASDERAVVGPDLRVHGVDGLMVADASIFPDNIQNNPHLTCLMVGEMAADLAAGVAA